MNKIIFVLGLALIGLNAHADAPTYKANIAPLFQKYCAACHGDGSDNGNLMDYATALSMKDAIGSAIADGSMPMGSASKKITTDERSAIALWVAAGAPQGN